MRLFSLCAALAALLVPHIGSAQDQFDIVRIKSPYSVSLGTSDYQYVELKVSVGIPVAGQNQASHIIKLSDDGTADGVAVSEFKRTTKERGGDALARSVRGDGKAKIATQEVYKSVFDNIQSRKSVKVFYGLYNAKTAAGEWHSIRGDAPDIKIVSKTDSEALKLASTSHRRGARQYGFNDNEAVYGLTRQPETVGIVLTNPVQQSSVTDALVTKPGNQN
ncbi:MAG: hypothetical protein AAF562_02970 [Pseudomonadota bacterium]